MTKDWIRLEKAWSLYLRSNIDNTSPDLRTYNTFGVGVELLGKHQNGSLAEHQSTHDPTDFFERIILQYPHRNSQGAAVSSLELYPIFFATMIRNVLTSAQHQTSPNRSSDIDFQNTCPALRYDIDSTFEGIQGILDRIESLLHSPPFSECLKLKQIRSSILAFEGSRKDIYR